MAGYWLNSFFARLWTETECFAVLLRFVLLLRLVVFCSVFLSCTVAQCFVMFAVFCCVFLCFVLFCFVVSCCFVNTVEPLLSGHPY